MSNRASRNLPSLIIHCNGVQSPARNKKTVRRRTSKITATRGAPRYLQRCHPHPWPSPRPVRSTEAGGCSPGGSSSFSGGACSLLLAGARPPQPARRTVTAGPAADHPSPALFTSGCSRSHSQMLPPVARQPGPDTQGSRTQGPTVRVGPYSTPQAS